MLFLDDLKDRNQACSVRFPCKIGLKTQLCGCYRHSASTLCYKPPKQQNLWVNRRKIQADDLQPKKAQIFTAEDKAWNLRWKENDWTSRGRRCFKKGCWFMFKCGFFFFYFVDVWTSAAPSRMQGGGFITKRAENTDLLSN